MGSTFVAHRLEGVLGEQMADARAPGARHGVAQIFGELARGAFGRLERDIAAEAFGDDHVGIAAADAVAFDEADEFELRQIGGAQQLRAASRISSPPLISSTPILSRPTVGRARSNSALRHGAAHDGERLQVVGVAADGGAEIEHDRVAAQWSARSRGQAGTLDTVEHAAQAKARHRHQRAGIAGGDRDIGLALLHRLDRQPHRRDLAATAQRLAQLVVHTDGNVGMDHLRYGLQCRMVSEFFLDRALSPNSRNSLSGCRVNEIAAPGMTTDAPMSPPMASSAMRTFFGAWTFRKPVSCGL